MAPEADRPEVRWNRRPPARQTTDGIRGRISRSPDGYRERDWGYTRILGELKKLGITKICRSTVINILRENKLDPRTDPGKGTWAHFLRSHGESLWQCDFFSKNIITDDRVRQAFVLAARLVAPGLGQSLHVLHEPPVDEASGRGVRAVCEREGDPGGDRPAGP